MGMEIRNDGQNEDEPSEGNEDLEPTPDAPAVRVNINGWEVDLRDGDKLEVTRRGKLEIYVDISRPGEDGRQMLQVGLAKGFTVTRKEDREAA